MMLIPVMFHKMAGTLPYPFEISSSHGGEYEDDFWDVARWKSSKHRPTLQRCSVPPSSSYS
jgi:hypothetical protein